MVPNSDGFLLMQSFQMVLHWTADRGQWYQEYTLPWHSHFADSPCICYSEKTVKKKNDFYLRFSSSVSKVDGSVATPQVLRIDTVRRKGRVWTRLTSRCLLNGMNCFGGVWQTAQRGTLRSSSWNELFNWQKLAKVFWCKSINTWKGSSHSEWHSAMIMQRNLLVRIDFEELTALKTTANIVTCWATPGLYAPLLACGTLLVNGTAASCYALPTAIAEPWWHGNPGLWKMARPHWSSWRSSLYFHTNLMSTSDFNTQIICFWLNPQQQKH